MSSFTSLSYHLMFSMFSTKYRKPILGHYSGPLTRRELQPIPAAYA
jgi:hypothetical protein